MLSLLDLSPERAVRLIALEALLGAAAARQRVADSGSTETESLHEMRRALRRLRTTLRAYRPYLKGSVKKKHRRRLREVIRATGTARDLEVQIRWLNEERSVVDRAETAAEWMLEHLRERQSATDAEMRRHFERFPRLRRKLERRLSVYTASLDPANPRAGPNFAPVFADACLHATRVLQSRLTAVRTADDQAEAHRARIAGRRLRDLLQPVEGEIGASEVIRRLEQLHDLLGGMREAELLGSRVARHLRRLDPTELSGEIGTGLATLRDRLQERRADCFAELSAAWLRNHADAFFTEVRRLADGVRFRGGEDLEIERKYLLRRLPEVIRAPEVIEVDQGYLPGERLVERLRRVRDGAGERFFRTVKQGRGIVRLEIEEETTPDLFARLWPLTEGRRVWKRRYRVAEGGLTWEIDEFTDRDLVLAEVELPSVDTHAEIPPWLAPFVTREVTDEPEYLNVNLAR